MACSGHWARHKLASGIFSQIRTPSRAWAINLHCKASQPGENYFGVPGRGTRFQAASSWKTSDVAPSTRLWYLAAVSGDNASALLCIGPIKQTPRTAIRHFYCCYWYNPYCYPNGVEVKRFRPGAGGPETRREFGINEMESSQGLSERLVRGTESKSLLRPSNRYRRTLRFGFCSWAAEVCMLKLRSN